MSELTDAADAYVAKRKALWKAKRQELEAELHQSSERKNFANEIYSAKVYLTMDEIAAEINNKNKNLLYKVIRDTVPVLMINSETEKISPVVANYSLTKISNSTVGVSIDGKENVTLHLNEFGEITNVPHDWYDPELTTEAERATYKQIISEIENG